MPTLEDFRTKTGEFADDPASVPDAEVQIEDVPPAPQNPEEPVNDDHVIDPEPPTLPEDEEEDELPPEQKTAFQKRYEREKRKMEETKAKELDEALAPYKRVVDLLGGDLSAIEQTVQRNQMMDNAQRMAEQYDWTEQETQWYIQQEQTKLNQQRMEKELSELRIANEINDLRDKPDYAGITGMKKDIIDKVSKSNGALTVQEAYWALGGSRRAEQIKREAEQREVAKRQQKRVVQSDNAVTNTGEKTLPPDVLAQAKRLNLSPAQAIELMAFEATNIHEARKLKK